MKVRGISVMVLIAVLVVGALPAWAQGDTQGHDRWIELGSVQQSSGEMIYIQERPIGLRYNESMTLNGVTHCTAEDGCEEGQPVQVELQWRSVASLPEGADLSQISLNFEEIKWTFMGQVSGRVSTDQGAGAFQGPLQARLTCAGADCQTLNAQVMACGQLANGQQAGVLLNGQVAPSGGTAWTTLETGDIVLSWQAARGAVYVTSDTNQICGQLGVAAGSKAADGDEQDASGGAETRSGGEDFRVDRGYVLENVMVTSLMESEGIWYFTVNGYWLNACEAQATVEVGEWQVRGDRALLPVHISRQIDDPASCEQGVLQPATYEVKSPRDAASGMATGRRFVVVNGIIAILIG